jgi:hypothetical protein
MMMYMFVIASVCGAVNIWLGIWARFQPYPASLIGLMLLVMLALSDMIVIFQRTVPLTSVVTALAIRGYFLFAIFQALLLALEARQPIQLPRSVRS